MLGVRVLPGVPWSIRQCGWPALLFNMKNKLVIKIISNLFIGSGIALLLLAFWPTISSEFLFKWQQFVNRKYSIENEQLVIKEKPSPFARLIDQPTPVRTEPVSHNFGIVIEKIGVNAPIIADVDVTKEEIYNKALENGVAHAKGTAYPGTDNNIYLFAHSSLNFWQLGEYATVFNLIRKLEKGDRIVLFYQNDIYDYRVEKKEILDGFDTSPLTRQYENETLTLQTCHPPGTTMRRLIITAPRYD